MSYLEESGRSDRVTLRRLAHELGITPENLKALEKRGRLPKGCEAEMDLLTGTRYWTREQVKKLKEWNEERLRQLRPAEPLVEEERPAEPSEEAERQVQAPTEEERPAEPTAEGEQQAEPSEGEAE